MSRLALPDGASEVSRMNVRWNACRRLAGTAWWLVTVVAACGGPSLAVAGEIAEGDSVYAQGSLAGALAHYRTALKNEPHHFATLWRMARVESELGEDAQGEEQRELISSAVTHAREAVTVAPDSALGHVWLSVALGRQALKEGPKAKLALSREIKSEVDRAIELDPSSARAYHVRAAWNRKIATLSMLERLAANSVLGGVPRGASLDNAVRDF